MGNALNDQAEIEASIAAQLERRLTEDDAAPNDTVAWTTIRTEAQARWQINKGAINEYRHTLK